jgi:uroporphyrinogen-III synthase
MKVLVTRAQPEAARWVQDLQARGLPAVALPLMAVQPTDDARPVREAAARLPQYAAVMFVSAHAAEGFFRGCPQAASRFGAAAGAAPRAWATGPGTAAALQQQGLAAAAIDTPPLAAGAFDSEALWPVVAGQIGPGRNLLIVRGADGDTAAGATGVGRDWLAQRAQAAGAQVDFVVSYRRCLPEWDAQVRALAREAALGQALWLFSSSQAIANLAQLMPQQDWSRAQAMATHERIADSARKAGFGVVCLSRPGLSDVVASIESMQ